MNRRNVHKKTRDGLLWPALLSGVLLWLSYPPFRTGWLAWVALVPLSAAAVTAARTPRGRRRTGPVAALWGGALWGLGLFHPLLFTTEGSLSQQMGGLIILTGLLAIASGAHFIIVRSVYTRWAHNKPMVVLLAASGWVAVEFITRSIAVGFASYIGVTQWQQPSLLSFASVAGIHGISWLVVAVNMTLMLVMDRFFPQAIVRSGDTVGVFPPHNTMRSAWVLFGTAAAVTAAVSGFPGHRLLNDSSPVDSPPVRLLLVQPNITNEQYFAIDRGHAGHLDVLQHLIDVSENALATIACPAAEDACLQSASFPDGDVAHGETDEAAATAPLLVVWPETVMHYAGANDRHVQATIHDFTSRWNVGLVMGMPRLEVGPEVGNDSTLPRGTDGAQYNSVFLYEPTGGVGQPVYDKIHVIPIAEADFAAGTTAQTVTYAQHALGVGICSDVVVPQHARRTVLAGAHTLHYVASFGQIARLAPLASALAMFRAAEHRVYLTQTATTGPSLVVNPQGEIVATTQINETATLAVYVPAFTWRPTLYTRYGDWLIVLSGLFVSVAMGRSRR